MKPQVLNIPRAEQETTIAYMANDEMISIYTSVKRDISKVMKIAKEENIEVLSVNEKGEVTSLKALLHPKNINIRNIPSTCKLD